VEAARSLLASGCVSKALLLERSEGEFLEALQLVASAEEFKKKEVRVNTKAVYNQTKFNLLREEAEGYAKALTLLNNSARATRLAAGHGAEVVRTLQSLIGCFDLDPNRVFDLVLDRRVSGCSCATGL
jgi:THO complex subunit 2